MCDPFVGEIRMVGFNYNPQGWALCQGQLLPIAQNAALFSLLGTTFGGDGRVTFGLPDFRGRGPVGVGTGAGLTPIAQGESSGNESVTLLQPQMPMHTHSASGTVTLDVGGTPSNQAVAPSATNNVLGASVAGNPAAAAIWSDKLIGPVALANPQTVAVTVGTAGGNQPLGLRNPFLGTNFIIALVGIFPPRD